MSIIQGRHGHIRLGTDVPASAIPVHNWGLNAPRNIITGQPLGNTWATNFAEGFQTTRFTFSVLLRNNATEAMALSFWQRFFQRTWAAGIDDTAGFDAFLYTGRRRYTIANCKAEAITITLQKGPPVGLTCVFVAPGLPVLTDVAVSDYSTTVDAAAPLMFDQAILTGFGAPIYGLELTYANNHIPNAPLDGTKTAVSFVAGTITAGIAVTVLETAGAPPIDAASGANIALVGGVTRNLQLGPIVINNPRDVGVNLGPVMRTFNGTILGGFAASIPFAPVRVT